MVSKSLTLACLFFPALAQAAAPKTPSPNVILIAVDTLRADHTGFLGYSRDVTPRLDELSRKSYVFSQAIAQAPWTLPSILSVFTSLPPHAHGIVNKFDLSAGEALKLASLPKDLATLPRVFKDNGYATAAFTGGAGLAGHFGFSSGFDVYSDSETFAGFDRTVGQALRWIEKHRADKFFLFLHGYDAHGQSPLRPKPRFAGRSYGRHLDLPSQARRLRIQTVKNEPIEISSAELRLLIDRYDDKVAHADAQLGRFLARLAQLGLLENSIIALFSDHGDQFYERGGFDHGTTLYDELIRVPLLLYTPGRPGGRIDSQVRLIDLMPTLLELASVKAPRAAIRQMQGRSLAPLMAGEPLDLPALSETDFLLHVFKRSLRTPDGWKLIYDFGSESDESLELYNWKEDPGEKRNLAAQEPERAARLKRQLLEMMRPAEP